jgi:hypothetical protein
MGHSTGRRCVTETAAEPGFGCVGLARAANCPPITDGRSPASPNRQSMRIRVGFGPGAARREKTAPCRRPVY